MSELYEWIRNLVCYLIFMIMILNLLPDRKYEKYLRLFAGMVFLLLVLGPFAQVGGVEEQMAGLFERLTFQNDAALLRREIEDMDGKQMSRLTGAYEEAVEENIRQMTGALRAECRSVEVVMDTDSDSGQFGSVLSVEIHLSTAPEGGRELRMEVNREVPALKKKIGEYYGLEEHHIAVILEEG